MINQVNAYSDQLSTNSTSGIGLSPYEIESLKLQDDPQIAHCGYIFLISAKTSFDILICLTDLIMNKTIRKEKGIDLPDFNIFYSVVKKPTKKHLFFCKRKKKYNECGKVDLLKPVFQKTYGNSYVKKIFDIRNMLIHKGYLCKIVFYGKKSMGHKIFIEQGFNVPNPKKEEIKIEELAKAYFKTISDMDSQISVILQNNFDYLSNEPGSISEVSFNGSFARYELK